MKLSKLWKTLSRDEKSAWNGWAKNNRVMLEDGNVRRVSGHKAFTVILNNRAIAVDAAAASKSPVATAFCYRIYGGELFRPVRCGQRSAFICVHLRLRHKSRKISSRHVAVPSENCRP